LKNLNGGKCVQAERKLNSASLTQTSGEKKKVLQKSPLCKLLLLSLDVWRSIVYPKRKLQPFEKVKNASLLSLSLFSFSSFSFLCWWRSRRKVFFSKHLPISETPKIQKRVTGEQEVVFGKRKRKSGTKGLQEKNRGNNCRECCDA
jgi:hypothetical protein